MGLFRKSEGYTNDSTRWLLVGLGNPGKKYEGTRHNIGFRVIQYFSRLHQIAGKQESKFKAILGQGNIGLSSVVLVQPLTYMNLSGESVSKVLGFYKVPLERLLVIYDDSALPFGKIRIRASGRAGGHNGMKSIIQALGGETHFPRLRVGIGEALPESALADFVLSRFTSEEEKQLETILSYSAQAIETLLSQGIDKTMSLYNAVDTKGPSV